MLKPMNQLVAMRLIRGLCLLAIASNWGAMGSAHAQQAAPVLKGYEEIAKPFIKQHCLSCHGAEKAKAGYRIDLIGTDFSAATVAGHWKEVIDRINAGEMPPKESPRPDAQQVAAFVTWVNEQLHQVELAAKNAGGRIPMRRLNRDEYANTVRDLLKLDEHAATKSARRAMQSSIRLVERSRTTTPSVPGASDSMAKAFAARTARGSMSAVPSQTAASSRRSTNTKRAC